MEDIEDLILSDEYFDLYSRVPREGVMPRVRKRNKIANTELAQQLRNGLCPPEFNKTSDSCCNSSLNPDAVSCDDANCCQVKPGKSASNSCQDNSAEKDNKCPDNKTIQNNSDCCSGSGSSCCKTVSQNGLIAKESNESVLANGFVSAASEALSKEETNGSSISNIPGLARIFVRTWGCAHNSSDSEYMAGQLAAYGYDIVDSSESADLWLLNSCTVKSPAEHHLRNEIKAALGLGKKVVVAGCVSEGAPKSEFLAGLSIVGVQQIDRVVEVVEETLRGNSVRMLGTKKLGKKKLGGASLQLPKIRRNPLIEILSINTGCLNQCTYCKTKHARGQLASYPIDELVARAEQSFKEGVVEIWLTSEDTGAYGRDIGVTLPELLQKLVQVIPEGCKLRLGMTNPPYILDHLTEMGRILQHPRVYKFLHVPVQSGSTNVLYDMKREYTREEFCTVVDTLRDSVPGITIATDIICGYPTETEEDFQETMSLCRHYLFPSLFINQYFPRPGTPAAALTKIHPKQVKRRTKELSDLFQSYRPYDHKLGEVQSILVTEESHDKLHWVGHNQYYDQVLVPKEQDYLGKTLQVVISETGKHHLKGRVLDPAAIVSPALATPLPQGAVSGNTSPSKASSPEVARRGGLVRQENLILMSFVMLITAALARLAWLCWRMAGF
uniref:Threonylcarbamoyladenosine tRNA methylthiotransferase n=1 Tax=Hirondellea gigas TaxID=1518452 RepID=A0A2P2I1K8_9CRUS